MMKTFVTEFDEFDPACAESIEDIIDAFAFDDTFADADMSFAENDAESQAQALELTAALEALEIDATCTYAVSESESVTFLRVS